LTSAARSDPVGAICAFCSALADWASAPPAPDARAKAAAISPRRMSTARIHILPSTHRLRDLAPRDQVCGPS
jgi:hypothetical protein